MNSISVFIAVHFFFPFSQNFEPVFINHLLQELSIRFRHLCFLCRPNQFEHLVNSSEKIHPVFPFSLSFCMKMRWLVVI
jgi:hypothetical protein